MKEQKAIVLERKIGKFRVSRTLLECTDLSLLFSQVLIVRCECLAMEDCFEYDAYSELFESVPTGIKAPMYQFEITKYNIKAIKEG